MLQTATEERAETETALYRKVLTARLVDEKMAKLVRQNKGGSFHLYALGHELVGSAFGHVLQPGSDWALPYYRDRAFVLSFGCSMQELFGAFMAREIPHHSRGRMMPEHFSDRARRVFCQSSCVGSQFLHAVGIAMGIKLAKKNEVVYVSAGDGASSQGDFHEALNFSCLHALPIIFVIQDNGWAISVPVREQTAGGCCSAFGRGYEGLTTMVVDGADASAMLESAEHAAQLARESGPVLCVAKTPRIGPHSSSDNPKKYKTDSEEAEDRARDPLQAMASCLTREHGYTEKELEALREEVALEVERAAKAAEAYPSPKAADAARHVYAPAETSTQVIEQGDGEGVVLMDALNHALHEEMERDPNVVVFGQDVAGGKGGVFGITRGLTEAFGSDRCFNTPLAESTIVGVAIGLAAYGYIPVVEIQFCDYMWTAANQIINELAGISYRSGGEWQCPLVIRMPSGGYIQGGPYHSQSVEAYLCHTPGLKVVSVSNSADGKRLLKGAIRDPNPCIFLEHKALYRQRSFSAMPEPNKGEVEPLGAAHIIHEGADASCIAWGYVVTLCSDIVKKLKKEGFAVELIDLPTLSPIDYEAILASVRKTGKLLVAHEAVKTCGLGAEIASRVAEEAFEYLDAPIARVGALDCPVPYAKPLEEAVLPQKTEIETALRALLRF